MKEKHNTKDRHTLYSSLHPLVSIAISIIVLTSGLFMQQNNQLFYYIIFIAMLTLISGNYKTLFKIILFFIPLGLLIALISYLITENSSQAIKTILRFGIIGLSVSFTFDMDPTELSRSLNQIGCPRRISLAILVVFSYIPVLRKEIGRVKEAMKVRGVKWWNPINYYRVLFLPLIIRMIEMSDTLALSIETRGFASRGKSSIYKRVYVRKKDIFILSLLIIGTILTFLKLWSGFP
jgi:energy-coupling factor transport system permease protein